MKSKLVCGSSDTDQPDSPHSLRAITLKDQALYELLKGKVICIHVFAYYKLYIYCFQQLSFAEKLEKDFTFQCFALFTQPVSNLHVVHTPVSCYTRLRVS